MIHPRYMTTHIYTTNISNSNLHHTYKNINILDIFLIFKCIWIEMMKEERRVFKDIFICYWLTSLYKSPITLKAYCTSFYFHQIIYEETYDSIVRISLFFKDKLVHCLYSDLSIMKRLFSYNIYYDICFEPFFV